MQSRTRKKTLLGTMTLTLTLGLATAGLPSCSLGQEEQRPGAWQHVPAAKPHTDHQTFFNEPFADGPAVTKACLECHEDAAAEMMKTVHWTWLGEEVLVPGHDKPTRIGKKNVINNFCIGVASNWGACTSCHAGYGWEDDKFDFSAADRVDCLVCHDHSGTYSKKPKGAGWPAPDADLLVAARSVGRPTRSNCGACHFRGGGGNAVKHGDLDDTLLNPVERIDVHMGRHRFDCIACHQTEAHQIPGRSISVSVQDTDRVRCTDCHQGSVHGDSRLNKHTDRVACQTCHIPQMAVETPTKMTWDWSQAGQDLDIVDKHVYMKIKGRFSYQKNGRPEYAWYNETSSRYLLGDTMDPQQSTKIAYPLGDRQDPKAKIWPFKIHRGKQPYDKKHNYFLVPNVHGEEGYWSIFDWSKALHNGAKASGMDFSGEYGFAPTEMYWPLSHMVATKDKALGCRDCHGKRGRLDWKALGYDRDPLAGEEVEHEEIVLKDADEQPVIDSGKPLSLSKTCGECHDPTEEDFQALHAYHQKLELDRLPAHRRALLQDGPRLVEGEATNCLLCHLEGAADQARLDEIRAGRAVWSQTATLAATGAVERTGDGWSYKATSFGDDKEISLPLGPPSEDRCGACHGLVHNGDAPLTLSGGSDRLWVTEKSGQVFSGQRIRLSALDIQGKDQLRQAWDVHAERLVTCAECHYAKDLPARFEKEGVKAAQAAAGQRRRCQSCHPMTGSHAWLPEAEKHMARVSCEACHVPRLHMFARQVEDATVMTRAGDMGLIYRGLKGQTFTASKPFITGFEPVLLPDAKSGLVGPYNLITTFRWVFGDKGQPVSTEALRKAWLTKGAYPADIVAALDADKDGDLQAQELRLDTPAKADLIAGKLRAQGLEGVRIEGMVRSEAIHHNMTSGPFARKDCTDCHERQGQKQLRKRPLVELSPFGPAGLIPTPRAEDDADLGGEIKAGPDGHLLFDPAGFQETAK